MKPDDFPILSQAELRRRIAKYRGESCRYRPKPHEKSTKIRIWDIILLAKIDPPRKLWLFLKGEYKFGPVVTRRLSRIVMLVDAGRITKSQYGAYHFHDEPVAPVVREMRVSLGSNGVSLNKQNNAAVPVTMPDFSKVFGGK